MGMGFDIRSRQSTAGREVVGGLTTFMAMSYILFVQPAVLSIARDVSLRWEHEQARNSLLKELQAAMVKIKTLKGMIPICSNCKKLRNDDGYWQQVEEYLRQHTDADFSYGLCDQCSAELYPEFSVPGKKGG